MVPLSWARKQKKSISAVNVLITCPSVHRVVGNKIKSKQYYNLDILFSITSFFLVQIIYSVKIIKNTFG